MAAETEAIEESAGRRPDLDGRWGPIKWSEVERDYRSGTLSLRELARKYQCSHSTIANRATKSGWTRGEPAASASSPQRVERSRSDSQRLAATQ